MQNDLHTFYNYCIDNNLKLNIDKCYTITFSRKKYPINYLYNFKNTCIKRVTEVGDLGVLLDDTLSFVPHINRITDRAYKMLGFVFRQCKDFKNINTYLVLYNSLVRTHLEFASIIWNPIYAKYKNQIEGIQNKFVRRLRYRFNNSSTQLLSLQQRREHRDQIFLYKIVHSIVDSPYLLGQIDFRCPRLTARSNSLFSVPTYKTNYSYNRFLVRACRTYNASYSEIDIFHKELAQYVSLIKMIRTDA